MGSNELRFFVFTCNSIFFDHLSTVYAIPSSEFIDLVGEAVGVIVQWVGKYVAYPVYRLEFVVLPLANNLVLVFGRVWIVLEADRWICGLHWVPQSWQIIFSFRWHWWGRQKRVRFLFMNLGFKFLILIWQRESVWEVNRNRQQYGFQHGLSHSRYCMGTFICFPDLVAGSFTAKASPVFWWIIAGINAVRKLTKISLPHFGLAESSQLNHVDMWICFCPMCFQSRSCVAAPLRSLFNDVINDTVDLNTCVVVGNFHGVLQWFVYKCRSLLGSPFFCCTSKLPCDHLLPFSRTRDDIVTLWARICRWWRFQCFIFESG